MIDHPPQPAAPPCWCRRQEPPGIAESYAPAGGLACAEEVIELLRVGQAPQPVSLLARAIVTRSVICVSLHAQYLFPRIQFECGTGRIRGGVLDIIAELRDVYDDLEVATWFVRRNDWLGAQAPWELLLVDPARALEAARADRYVARG